MSENNGAEKGTAVNWDDRVEAPKEGNVSALLPAGNYPFTITKFERGRHEGSDKIGPCPMAIITFEVDGGDLGSAWLVRRFYLNTKTLGFICELLNSLGVRRHGEPLDLSVLSASLVGMCGECHVKQKEYQGEKQNDIKNFLEPKGEETEQPVDVNGEAIPF